MLETPQYRRRPGPGSGARAHMKRVHRLVPLPLVRMILCVCLFVSVLLYVCGDYLPTDNIIDLRSEARFVDLT